MRNVLIWETEECNNHIQNGIHTHIQLYCCLYVQSNPNQLMTKSKFKTINICSNMHIIELYIVHAISNYSASLAIKSIIV